MQGVSKHMDDSGAKLTVIYKRARVGLRKVLRVFYVRMSIERKALHNKKSMENEDGGPNTFDAAQGSNVEALYFSDGAHCSTMVTTGALLQHRVEAQGFE